MPQTRYLDDWQVRMLEVVSVLNSSRPPAPFIVISPWLDVVQRGSVVCICAVHRRSEGGDDGSTFACCSMRFVVYC